MTTDLWAQTHESVRQAPTLPAADAATGPGGFSGLSGIGSIATYSDVVFDVGLWRVCSSSYKQGNRFDASSCAKIHYLSWWKDLHWRSLGLLSPVDCTTSFASRIRISTLLTVLSVAVLGAASLFAYVGHCTRGAKMLMASGLYAIGGLILGSALIVFACVLSDECGEHPLAQPPTLSPYHPDFGQHQQQHGHRYAYGWSYLMAIAAFLGAEVSAALCLSAFLGRFESEEEFVKQLPGMERRLVEHAQLLLHQNDACLASATASDQSQEVPLLLRGSFGHRATVNSSDSQDSLYGLDHRSMVASESAHSSVNAAPGPVPSATVAIPVKVDITPAPLPLRQYRQPPGDFSQSSFGRPQIMSPVGTALNDSSSQFAQQQHHVSPPQAFAMVSPMQPEPPRASPPSGFHRDLSPISEHHQHRPHAQHNVLRPTATASSLLMRPSTSSTITTLPRHFGASVPIANSLNHHRRSINGESASSSSSYHSMELATTAHQGGIKQNGALVPEHQRHAAPENARIALATATMPRSSENGRKKKTVTIGTFTTVDPPFENDGSNGGPACASAV